MVSESYRDQRWAHWVTKREQKEKRYNKEHIVPENCMHCPNRRRTYENSIQHCHTPHFEEQRDRVDGFCLVPKVGRRPDCPLEIMKLRGDI